MSLIPIAPWCQDRLHTAQAKADRKFAGKTLTVELTGYDTAADMVRFQLVEYVKGGENNGHYEDLPQAPGTHP